MTALVAQWIEHGSPKAGVGGSIPLWGTFVTPVANWRFPCSGGVFPFSTTPANSVNLLLAGWGTGGSILVRALNRSDPQWTIHKHMFSSISEKKKLA